MDEVPLPSSPESHYYEQYKIIDGQENVPSSPLRLRNSQKPSKPPTVTPKRFTKFFTPRSTKHILNARHSNAGRQLRDITRNGINRRRAVAVANGALPDTPPEELDFQSPAKRRKLADDFSSPPLQSSPLKHIQIDVQPTIFEDSPSPASLAEIDALPEPLQVKPLPRAIRRLRPQGPSRRILERSFGDHDSVTRGRHSRQHATYPTAETAAFYSDASDCHVVPHGRSRALPFCSASCNTNSLVAIGDEEGHVLLIDSSPLASMTDLHIKFQVHHNAILDIAFSADDYILVTAGGDQTGRVVDMRTQQTRCILAGHKSTIKSIQFQPGSNDLMTTSGRDGAVMFWDLRVGGKSAVQSLRTSYTARLDGDGNLEPEARYTDSRLKVGYAHATTIRPFAADSELSITSFQHLPHGREHLILTASEADASIKLWDIRNATRRSDPLPLASAAPPESHRQTRNYGTTDMVLSGDGARLYTLCRDSTVYAYSTNHIALGHLPEMSTSSRRRYVKEPKAGLGPLYGFRHPSLRVASFYIKAALRPAHGDRPELLAVGSTDRTPILFPTDESYLPPRHSLARDADSHDVDEPSDDGPDPDLDLPTAPPSSQRSSTSTARSRPPGIIQHGTALVRGHTKEVTAVGWSHDGDLVSVGDDYSVRCWREDAEVARVLRCNGELGGRRWGCGWADVDAEWDEEDC